MANSEQSTAKSTWVSEGILIASAPVAASVVALTYIAGYASYFEIPTEFLSLNVTTLFVVGGKILNLALFAFLLFFFVFQLVPDTDNPLRRRILAISPWAVLLFLQVLFFDGKWREWLSTLMWTLLLVLTLFVGPLLHRGKSSYMERLSEADRRFNAGPQTVAHQLLLSNRSARILIFAFYVFFVLTAAYSYGRFDAMWKKEFLVPASSPDSVVLSSFGDNVLVAPFDRKTKQVERSFSILKKGEDPKLLLRWEVVGPLQPKSK